MWSSLAVAHSCQGLAMVCFQTHFSAEHIVKSGYFYYCSLPVSWFSAELSQQQGWMFFFLHSPMQILENVCIYPYKY